MKAVKETVRNYYKYDYANPIYGGTFVGNLTNNNGIISGFTANDYIRVGTVGDVSNYEVVVKFKSNSLSATQSICGSENSTGVYTTQWMDITTNGRLGAPYNSTSYLYILGVQTGVWQWAKLTYDGSEQAIWLSTDGENYTKGTSRSVSTIFASNIWCLGIGTGGSATHPKYPFNGEIDLNGTYYKKKGVYWYKGVDYPLIAGTSSDYDFYEDVDIYKAIGQYKGFN